MTMYNSEDTIRRCLDSIIYADAVNNFKFEVIIVDDCSTDSSRVVVQEYVQKYENIKLITNKENSGISATRNKGLAYSTGEYFTYVDSDDSIDKLYFKSLCKVIESNKYDLIEFGYKKINENGVEAEEVINGCFQFELSNMLSAYFDTEKRDSIGSYTWNKLFKKSLCVNNKITFDENHIYEDVDFVIEYFTYVQNVFYVGKSLYNYFQRGNSTVNTVNKKLVMDRIWSLEQVKKHGKDLDIVGIDFMIDKYCANTLFYLYKLVVNSNLNNLRIEKLIREKILETVNFKVLSLKQKVKLVFLRMHLLKLFLK
ncbi:glycosyltransferase family 2 protein [Pediococcus acidilactici]|uniref:glycosyltransferase family 2 protein n=1 Tax=Pediococcus acidilactici TaxID=1254 RepID=UPI0020CE556A|nr:glycosyltransferase [Pediococcus acidilactici]MDG9740258.1 glycosyltransferase [Pediococcus acidilactici]